MTVMVRVVLHILYDIYWPCLDLLFIHSNISVSCCLIMLIKNFISFKKK